MICYRLFYITPSDGATSNISIVTNEDSAGIVPYAIPAPDVVPSVEGDRLTVSVPNNTVSLHELPITPKTKKQTKRKPRVQGV